MPFLLEVGLKVDTDSRDCVDGRAMNFFSRDRVDGISSFSLIATRSLRLILLSEFPGFVEGLEV